MEQEQGSPLEVFAVQQVQLLNQARSRFAQDGVFHRPLRRASLRKTSIAALDSSRITTFGTGIPSQVRPSCAVKPVECGALEFLFRAAAAIMVFALVADRRGIRFTRISINSLPVSSRGGHPP